MLGIGALKSDICPSPIWENKVVMNQKWPLLLLLSCTWLVVAAQNSAFGIKGGLTLGIQNWNNFQQDPLLKYHGILFIESADSEERFSLFAQGGYHLKGSAIRNRNFFSPINGQFYRPPAQEFIFKNISLTLGAKRKFEVGSKNRAFYLFGIRGDYTLGTNLSKYRELNELNNSLFFPDDAFVRKWNYGLTLGGGFELPFADLVGAVLEFTINPDFSFQYKQPRINNVYDPYTGQSRSISERTIRNVTFEVTLGIRLLRIVEYID